MQNKGVEMKAHLISLIVFSMVIGSACAPAVPVQLPQVETPTVIPPTDIPPTPDYLPYDSVKITASSLENNLIGESTQRTLYVYLPPSYKTSEKRYPVIYYLPGFGDSQMIRFNLPEDMDALIEKNQAREMIIVVINGTNKLGGSFYVNSPVTGNWEDFVIHDVVQYMDNHYRTLPSAASRGITGHSMGGFGALNLAMLHPDIFGAVYSMSPGLFDENGLAESQMFSEPSTIQSFVEYNQKVLAMPMDETAASMFQSPQEFAFAYGNAFAPKPGQHPPYYDYPYSEVNGQMVRDEAVWKKWEGGFGGIPDEVAQYKGNFLKLKGIVVDYGTEDAYAWIPKGCVYFGDQLTAAGIPVKIESFDGGHENELGTRIGDHMLPFFSSTLAFE
jgi:S-formylglutathione hydrolase